MSELPCPFCGHSDFKYIGIKSEDDGREYARAVFCRVCHATGPHNHRIGWAESDRAASEAWNNREGKMKRKRSLALL